MPKFTIKTLGCKVNQYESQILRENLVRFGFQGSGPREADVFIVNSCTVTVQADIKTRKLVRKAKQENPGVKVFVTGCGAVFDDDIRELRSMPEVYEVVPNRDKFRIPVMIDSLYGGKHAGEAVLEQVSGFSSHTRAFLKIQDGCDQNCSYCKVRLIRGVSRSRDERDVLAELLRLVDGGYKEIVLTGICLGSWKGAEGQDLAGLLREIDAVEGDFRIRLSSLEPDHIGKDLIDTIASSRKICRHLHIPIQSGSDRILEKMNRQYDSAQFKDLVKNIRERMPMAGLTMDVIVGFPGEEEKDFDDTRRFIREIKPGRLHVFKYSDRKGARSFLMENKVPPNTASGRVRRLIETGNALQAEFCRKFSGKEVEVLVEQRSEGSSFMGYTGEYVRAKIDGSPAMKGSLIRVKVDSVDENGPCLIAKKVNI